MILAMPVKGINDSSFFHGYIIVQKYSANSNKKKYENS